MSSFLSHPDGRIRSTLVAIGVGILAVVVTQFAVIPAIVIDTTVITAPEEAERLAVVLLLALNFVGFAIGGAFYLMITDRGWEWLDLRMPTRRDLLYMVGGFLLILLFNLLIGILSLALDLPSADSEITIYLQDDVMLILAMMGIVIFLNAPIEEFLFRNVIQKRLYAAYSGAGAIIVTSLLFTAFHIPMYITQAESATATGISLFVMFGGSVIFGWVYLRTENLFVPIVAHAAINLLVLTQILLTVI